MDKNARALSLVVAFLGIAFITLLARTTPRGGWTVFARDSGTTSGSSARDTAGGEVLEDQLELDGHPGQNALQPGIAEAAIEAHFQRLRSSQEPITAAEIERGAPLETAFEAVARLRPYWLEMTDQKQVRAGRQNVGDIDALRQIRIDVVEEIRLVFAAEDPHWSIEVAMR